MLHAILVGLLGAALAAPPEVPDGTEPFPGWEGPQRLSQESLPYPRARQMRDAGIGLTIPGIAFGALGAGLAIGGLASMSPCSADRPDCNTGEAFMVVFGGISGAIAAPFLAAGIPLWVIGSKRWQTQQVALHWAPTPGGHAVALSVRLP